MRLRIGEEVLLLPARSRVRVRRGGLVPVGGLTFEQAAAIPSRRQRRCAGPRRGPGERRQRVLVNGVKVGHLRIQIAAALAPRSPGCAARAMSSWCLIGATHVIDYTTDDFTGGRIDDVIFDNVSTPLSRLRWLTPKGTLVANGGGSPGHVFGRSLAGGGGRRSSQRLRPLPSRQNREELLAVTRLIEDGSSRRSSTGLPLAAAARACATWSRDMRGKAVVTVA